MSKFIKKYFPSIKDVQELIFLSIIFLVSLYFYFQSYSYKPSAQIFPKIISAVTIVLVLIHLLKGFLPKNLKAAVKMQEKKESQKTENIKQYVAMITIIYFVGFVIISYYFTFYVGAAVMSLVYPLTLGYRKPGHLIICFLASIIMVYTFQYFLRVPFTRGQILNLTKFLNF